MKYALLDGELHIHQRDTDAWWPLSLAEAQHVVDVMNAVAALPPGFLSSVLDAHALTCAPMKISATEPPAIASLVADVQNSFPLKGPDQ